MLRVIASSTLVEAIFVLVVVRMREDGGCTKSSHQSSGLRAFTSQTGLNMFGSDRSFTSHILNPPMIVMVLQFSPYEKMARDLRKFKSKELSKLEKEKWVVLEKIHGANFSFEYRNGTVQFARRRGYLNWEDSFFAFQTVASSIEANVQGLFDEVASTETILLEATDDNFQIIIYGELFGGKYPHPEVEANRTVEPIQNGIYYSPDICFCAFDIALVTTLTKEYLGYERCLELFDKHGIFHSKPLFIGSLSKALDFSTRKDSTVPIALGLPPLGTNLIEGVVVKPYCLRCNASKRVIFKTKNKEFDEDEQYRSSERWGYFPNTNCSMSVQTAAIVHEGLRLVTPLRLDSAASKIGNLADHLEEVKEEVRLDVLATLGDQGATESLSLSELRWVECRVDAAIDRLLAKTTES